MKTLIKFFITVLLLISCQPAFCQKLPPFANWYQGTINEYPVYKDYFEEYTSRLYDNLKIKENFPDYALLGVNYDFILHKDGSISDFEMYSTFRESLEYINKYFHPLTYYGLANYSKEFEQYVKEIIIKNPPKPFPKEINYEQMKIAIFIGQTDKKNQKKEYDDINSFYIMKNKKNCICAFNYGGGDTTTYNTAKKTTKHIPPKWAIRIIYLR